MELPKKDKKNTSVKKIARRLKKDYISDRNLTRSPKANIAIIGKHEVVKSVKEQQAKRLKARDNRADFRSKRRDSKED
jgi:hypothetical protein